MSDPTINQPRSSLKDLNVPFTKLRRAIDHMDILVHQQKRLTLHYQELSFLCSQLAENMDHIDVLVFKVRQELDKTNF